MAEWICAAHVVPELAGQGFYLASPDDLYRLEKAFTAVGYTVVRADGTADKPGTLTAISGALKVGKATNLDAFADVLGDLTAPTGRVILFWLGAGDLLENDLPSWVAVTEILRDASVAAWDPDNDDDPNNLVFEAIGFVAGFGVEPLS